MEFDGFSGFRLGGKIVVLVGFGTFNKPKTIQEHCSTSQKTPVLIWVQMVDTIPPNPSLVNMFFFPLLFLCLEPRMMILMILMMILMILLTILMMILMIPVTVNKNGNSRTRFLRVQHGEP